MPERNDRILERIPTGLIGTNTYIYGSGGSPDTHGTTGRTEVIIIDPGGDAARLIQRLDSSRYHPVGIIITHTHFDHILGLSGLIAQYGHDLPVLVHELGSPYLGSSGAAVLRAHMDRIIPGSVDEYASAIDSLPEATHRLTDSQEVSMGGLTLKVLHTPGHSSDSICLYDSSAGILFSGDTLFYRSIGRTDLIGGDLPEIERSIRQKLYTLPLEVRVYPGHGRATTIGEESHQNPFVSG